MKPETWKTIAIVFILLFVLETAYLGWSIISYNSEVNNYNECLYGICGEYPDAYYAEGICGCYDYGITGDLVLVKTEIIK